MILGIDPGMSGALAWLNDDGSINTLVDMPLTPDRRVDVQRVWDSLWSGDRTVIERVAGRNGQAGQNGFMANYGRLLGVVELLTEPILVSPQKWKAHHRLTGKDKHASRRLAQELWPDQAHLFKRAKDDGRAEAALIARWYLDTPAQWEDPAGLGIDA